MPVCCVTGCNTGYLKTVKKNKEEGNRNPSLFSVPKDGPLFSLWENKIPRKDRRLSPKDKVCSLHFAEEDLIKFEEKTLADGTIWRSERKQWNLRQGAVPRLFPNCPEYLSDFKHKRKSPPKRQTDADKQPTKRRKQNIVSAAARTMEVDRGVLLTDLITDENSASDDMPDNSSISILNNLLKCSICYDYFDTCVITDCSHNFCSLCIRKYIQYKTECPVCFKELYDSSLRANRIVDEFRKLFPEIKERIVRCVRTINSRKPGNVCASPAKAAEFKTPKSGHSSKVSIAPEVATVSTKPSPVSPSVPKPSGTQTPSTNERVLIPKMFFSPSKKSTSNAEKNCAMQECPVCTVFIPERNMNRHLDDCLKRSEEASKVKNSPPVNKRAPLPKLVFRLLSSTNLRNKAKEYGLNHHGDNETLKNRIQKYTALYNAECDKPNPRPVSELLRQLEKEEKVLASQKLPKNNIVAHLSDVTEKSKLNAQYLKENKKSFDDLIGKMKSQQANKKKDTKSVPPESQPVIQKTVKKSNPLADYCQPSTSKTHFDLNYSATNDDMLEIEEMDINEIKIEKVEDDLQPRREPVQPEIEEEDVFNPTKRTSVFHKRLDFEECSPEPPLFDAEHFKMEPDVEIFDALTDDENERPFDRDTGDEDDDSSDSVIFTMSTRRKRRAGDGPTKKNLRKRKR